ncbi:hypothetical protein MRX96_036613 [Rhipicephalus microplus]
MPPSSQSSQESCSATQAQTTRLGCLWPHEQWHCHLNPAPFNAIIYPAEEAPAYFLGLPSHAKRSILPPTQNPTNKFRGNMKAAPARAFPEEETGRDNSPFQTKILPLWRKWKQASSLALVHRKFEHDRSEGAIARA